MIVTTERLPQSQIKLRIEIPLNEVTPFLEKAAQRLSEKSLIKGFRKGRVPYDIVQHQFGEPAIYDEALQDVVDATYRKALEQEQLHVVSKAAIEVEKLAPGNPVVYTAVAALLPNVHLGDYRTFTLHTTKKEVVLDEKKVAQTIQSLRDMQAQEKLVQRPAQKSDIVLADVDITIGGVPIEGGKTTKQRMLFGEHTLLPGFEENILGMQKGEDKNFNITFPEKDAQAQYAGKTAQVHIHIHDVYERTLPTWDDAFAQGLHFASVTELEKNIRDNILREQNDAARQKWESDIIMEIIQQSQFDELPTQLIDDEVEKMMRELQDDIARQNVKYDDYLSHIKKTNDELRAHFREPAHKRIQAALVLRAIAIAERVAISEEDVNKEWEEWKKMYDQAPQVHPTLASDQMRHTIENMLLHRKTMELLSSFVQSRPQ